MRTSVMEAKTLDSRASWISLMVVIFGEKLRRKGEEEGEVGD